MYDADRPVVPRPPSFALGSPFAGTAAPPATFPAAVPTYADGVRLTHEASSQILALTALLDRMRLAGSGAEIPQSIPTPEAHRFGCVAALISRARNRRLGAAARTSACVDAIRVATDPDQRADAFLELALLRRGEESMRACDEAVACAIDPARKAEIAIRVGDATHAGETPYLGAAIRLHDVLAGRVASSRSESKVRSLLGRAYVGLGYARSEERWHDEALRYCDDPLVVARAWEGKGNAAFRARRTADACEAFAKSVGCAPPGPVRDRAAARLQMTENRLLAGAAPRFRRSASAERSAEMRPFDERR